VSETARSEARQARHSAFKKMNQERGNKCLFVADIDDKEMNCFASESALTDFIEKTNKGKLSITMDE
jgi:tRNA threonylcarbamoyladenosine modification (KEOPS) complex Cgi121 subunit